MKTAFFTSKVLILAILFGGCEGNLSAPKTNSTIVIDDQMAGVVTLSPTVVREPKTVVLLNTTQYEDGTFILDFENDHLWDIELLAIGSTSNHDGGVGVRAIPGTGISTYISLSPLNEKNTVNNNIDWTLINGQDITMLTMASNSTNAWSDFKYLAVKKYDQNKNSSKFYWIKLKVDDTKTGYEINSYFR